MINHLGGRYKDLWAEEIEAANNILRNRMYRDERQRNEMTPIEALTGARPDVSKCSQLWLRGISEYKESVTSRDIIQ